MPQWTSLVSGGRKRGQQPGCHVKTHNIKTMLWALKKEENERVHAETIKTYMWIRDAAIMTLYNYFQHTNDCFYTRLAPACVEAIIIIYDSEIRHIVYF